MLTLIAISLDGVLGTVQLGRWKLWRVALMALLMGWGAKATWEEAHTRRSNVNLIAAWLDRTASDHDLIIVQTAWEGITFKRYYGGSVHWETVPPIDSHSVHRTDLLLDEMNQPDAMAPLLAAVTKTLRSGNVVWVVGRFRLPAEGVLRSSVSRAGQPFPDPFAQWSGELRARLVGEAQTISTINVPVAGPVSHYENVPLVKCAGYVTAGD
jgi:hypothetical protein